ncbi:MAG: hypothetical protein ABII22_02820 [Candidatus Micrarchaeota archaeon]
MFDLISHLMDSFHGGEFGKLKMFAMGEVGKVGDTLRHTLEAAIVGAMTKIVPLLISAFLMLLGLIFLSFGAAKYLDYLLYPHSGLGYLVVGLIVVFFGLLIYSKNKKIHETSAKN